MKTNKLEYTKIMRFASVALIFTMLDSCFAKAKPGGSPQVEVRAVFINCEPDDRDSISEDNEATRFEREELFKHSVLQDCNKKIALTVKIASEPNHNSGDEYIPIEHVFRGQNKRVRLLDPYVLRLRREIPLQAYKLRRMATVNGLLSNTNENFVTESKDVEKISRSRSKRSLTPKDSSETAGKYQIAQHCDFTKNKTINKKNYKRDKRNEHNIVVEDSINEEKYPQWIAKDHFFQEFDKKREGQSNFYATSGNLPNHKIVKLHRNTDDNISSKLDERNNLNNLRRFNSYLNKDHTKRSGDTEPIDVNSKANWFSAESLETNSERNNKESYGKNNKKYNPGKEFDMYEIGNPDLLYTVQVQLFEKKTTPEGKTVWNDMTKGEPASVSTLSPEWIGSDMNIRYRPTEWISREDFTLPLASLCLLTPHMNSHKGSDADNVRSNYAEKFIVVPKEDILSLESDESNVQKRDGNFTNVQHSTTQNEQCKRRVIIRTSRAIFNGEDNFSITVNGGEQYLTLPHRRPHRSQIDLEARADGNQLVPVGSSGRIMTVVADSSRRTRTTLTVQVTNTGLAAAKFRAVARDCGPEFMSLQNDNMGDTFSDSAILLPPRHTRSIRLDVPTEIPAVVAHCFVSLLNEEDESVAVRDVTIRKGDRCFCVWHCECVCLSEDPKLLCREMTEARQIAAGLSLRERVRHARSVCYHDVVSINMLVTAFGVLITLLFFGLVKGILGLVFRCIGSWGLHRIVQMPRKLDHYYESSLRDCCVVYDAEGWPVHPTTKERTVRLVSKPMEFILNVIFFVCTPCIIVYEILQEICSRCKKSEEASDWHPCEKDKSCYSSHDIQGKKKRGRRRRRGIKKWMSPAAEDLSSNVWRGGLHENALVDNMRPLLREGFCCGEKMVVQQACIDSEGDDTEFVLMQMQKSKESLARSTRKLSGSNK